MATVEQEDESTHVQPLPTEVDGESQTLLLSDRPLRDDSYDRLGFKPYADALAQLIDSRKTDTPLTLAISAPWGAGKTSLARMVEDRLERWPPARGDPPHITCWFNAWANDDAPHLGSAFASAVAKTAGSARPIWRRIVSPIPSAMLDPQERFRRIVLLGVVSFAAAVATVLIAAKLHILASSKEPTTDQLTGTLGRTTAALVATFVVLFAVWNKLFAAAQKVARFVDDPKSEAAQGSMHQVSDQLGALIAQATRGKRRLVIFVDDLERCASTRAVDVCEVASQLLAHPGVVTVIVGDVAAIEAAAQRKYGLDGDSIGRAFGRAYLHKLIQMRFDLPPPRPEQLRVMLAASPDAQATARRGTVMPSSPSRSATKTGTSSATKVQTKSVTDARTGIFRTVLSHAGVWLWGVALLAGLFLLLGFITLLVSPSASSNAQSSTWPGDVLALLVTLSLVGGAIAYFVRRIRAARARRLTTQIDDQIQDRLRAGETSTENIKSRVLESTGPESERAELVNQRVQRLLFDSGLRKEAEAEVLDRLPPMPREAKRMLNHLRLMLRVAIARDIFGGIPALEARQLGKWVVLRETWPEVADRVRNDQGTLGKMEGKTADEIGAALGSDVVQPSQLESLREFFLQEPRMAPVVDRLLYLGPSAT